MAAESSRVLLGMSGGTDSSVSAWFLKRDGYQVVGVTLLFQDAPEQKRKCEQAIQTAERLGIEHHVIDVTAQFQEQVIEWYLAEVAAGRQPDPVVRINDSLLFPVLFEQADFFSCPSVATGHYAQIAQEEYGYGLLEYQLKMSMEKAKGQSYHLAGLSQEQLSRLVFPLSQQHKSWVRREAMRAGLAQVVPVEDGQGSPFFFEGNSASDWLIQGGYQGNPGDVVYISTQEVLGQHEGLASYEIGQEVFGYTPTPVGSVQDDAPEPKNSEVISSQTNQSLADQFEFDGKRDHELDIALRIESQIVQGQVGNEANVHEAAQEQHDLVESSEQTNRQRLLVVAKDLESNCLLVGFESLALVETCRLKNLNWTSVEPFDKKRSCKVQFRWNQKAYPAQLLAVGDDVIVSFNRGAIGIAPGQTAVFYSDDLVLGRGTVAG